MKLIIQIPCYNEENFLPVTLKCLPKTVDGFDSVEWLVIDDGSTDNTSRIAIEYGVHHIIRMPKNQGLARVFMAGLNKCIDLGADVIVNTDADNQYCSEDIPKLVKPILDGCAEIVIGERPIKTIQHFSPMKKLLQKLGSLVVRMASKTKIPDAPCGFRAFSRDAAMRMNVFSDYTYTIETIIQAGQKNMSVISVPINVNEYLRPSRLFKSIPAYLKRSIITILRIFVVYKPFKFFLTIGFMFFLAGFLFGLRFLFIYITGRSVGHIQSLILASILLGIGFQAMLFAFIADLQSVNRKLLEDVKYLLKKIRNSDN